MQNLNLSEKAKMKTEYFVLFCFWNLGLYSSLVQTNRDGIIYDESLEWNDKKLYI